MAAITTAADDRSLSARTSFSLQVGEHLNPFRRMTASVLPGEALAFSVASGAKKAEVAGYEGCATGGTLRALGRDSWSWKAPSEPALHTLVVTAPGGDRMALGVFVLQPYDGAQAVSGYEIGNYERVPLRNNPVYGMPKGFIEVTSAVADTPLSPHFRLRSFLSKQSSDWPKYVLADTRLLLKLEHLLEHVRAQGVDATTFAILSGFRTPQYNAAIGNRTRYSRHLYGDAADIYIDEDDDGRMDDLDGDGKVTEADAKKLAAIIDRAAKEAWYKPFVGGIGIYGPAPHRGPFVHVDTRGFQARW